jgi:hypothetical protein
MPTGLEAKALRYVPPMIVAPLEGNRTRVLGGAVLAGEAPAADSAGRTKAPSAIEISAPNSGISAACERAHMVRR